MGLQALFANETLIHAATGIAGGAISFLMFEFLFRVYRAHREAAQEIVVTETHSPVIRALLPTARMIGVTLSSLFGGRRKTSLFHRMLQGAGRRLAKAGSPEGINPEEYYGFAVLQGLLWMFVMTVFWSMLAESAMFPLWMYMGTGFVLGWMFWGSWLSSKIRIRQTEIRKNLPFALDLLTLSMEAGLDFTGALGRLAQKMRGSALGREFTLVLHEIQLGKTRVNALRDFMERLDMKEIRTVVASLIQADELGTSLGPILRIQSDQQRERRSQRAEESAMKAPVKMLFPLVLILMAMMATIATPIIISYLQMEG